MKCYRFYDTKLGCWYDHKGKTIFTKMCYGRSSIRHAYKYLTKEESNARFIPQEFELVTEYEYKGLQEADKWFQTLEVLPRELQYG